MNTSITTVTHTDERMYFMGRWFWTSKSIIRSQNYVCRYDYVYVGHGNNNDKWFYARYQDKPNFAINSRTRFTTVTAKVPF